MRTLNLCRHHHGDRLATIHARRENLPGKINARDNS